MQDGTDTLWGDSDPLTPPRRRSWKAELTGFGLVALGIACGIVGFKWGGSRNVQLVTIGVGIALVGAGSFLASWGSGRRVTRAVLSAVGIMMMLGGVAVGVLAYAEWQALTIDSESDSIPPQVLLAFGVVAFCLGLGLVRTAGWMRRATPRDIQMSYWQLKNQDVQQEIKEGEKRAEIERELKGD